MNDIDSSKFDSLYEHMINETTEYLLKSFKYPSIIYYHPSPKHPFYPQNPP